MRIIYRMRGLLGDATEEFIESLDSTTGDPIHNFHDYSVLRKRLEIMEMQGENMN